MIHILWRKPKYSEVVLEGVRSNCEDVFSVDASAPLLLDIKVGEYTETLETSGLATFRKSISAFRDDISTEKEKSWLIIDDDDGLTLLVNIRDGYAECKLHRAGSYLATAITSVEELRATVAAYLKEFDEFLIEERLTCVM